MFNIFKQPVQKLTVEQKNKIISFLVSFIENSPENQFYNIKQLLEIIPGETLNELINYLAREGLNIKNIENENEYYIVNSLSIFDKDIVPKFLEKEKQTKSTLKDFKLSKPIFDFENLKNKVEGERADVYMKKGKTSKRHPRIERPASPPPPPPSMATDPEIQEYLNILELPLDVLNLPKVELKKVINKAYRKLSLQNHPDRRGGDIEKFQAINTANEKLDELFNLSGSGRKKIHKSAWITHVKKIQKKHKCSYKDALSIASKTYHKK